MNNWNIANCAANEIGKLAVKTYGKEMQCIVAMEECSELIQAISKALRGNLNKDNLVEEIVDVEIMLAQLKYIFSINDNLLQSIKIHKCNRLMKRIGGTANE